MATYSIGWSAPLASTAGTVMVGHCLVQDSTGHHYVATAANRTLYGRAMGLSATVGTVDTPVVTMHEVGLVPPSISNLAAGTVSWLRVDAAGGLERCTPGVGDDIVGKCHADGSAQLYFGIVDSTNFANAGTFISPTGDGYAGVTSGALNAAAGPINLAGGSTYVTGVLPEANQADQTLAGDASGTTAAVVNDQARGLKTATTTVSVSTATAPTTGQVLTATSTTAATWQTPTTSASEIVGVLVVAMGDANQTPTAGDVSTHNTLKLTSTTQTIDRNLTLPTATDAAGYIRTIDNAITGIHTISGGLASVIVTTGAGTTVPVLAGERATVLVDSRGVTRLDYPGQFGSKAISLEGLGTYVLTADDFRYGLLKFTGNATLSACTVYGPKPQTTGQAYVRTVNCDFMSSSDVITFTGLYNGSSSGDVVAITTGNGVAGAATQILWFDSAGVSKGQT